MAVAAETIEYRQIHEETNSYLYEYDNASTWLAEVLDGSMRTNFEFRFDGRELYGHEGTALGKVFDDSLHDAERLADEQPNLLFELRRRHIEREEYKDMLAMARGKLPNTMVVISDFPPELMDVKEDIGGYNVTRKQTMLRIISYQSDGTLRMTSQSLDHSDRQALEAIYAQYGLQPDSGELLGQRIYVNTQIEEQPYVVDRLTGLYDRALAAHYGGDWYAGRRNEQRRNTYDFVRQQSDLLDYFVHARVHNPHESEKVRYDLAAAMVERFSGRSMQSVPSPSTYTENNTSYDGANIAGLHAELMRAGSEARAQGKVFSGCGASAKAEDGSSTGEQLDQAGYGNKSSDSSGSAEYKFNKKMHCVVCQRPPKQGEQPKQCGPCGICRTCDAHLKKSGGK